MKKSTVIILIVAAILLFPALAHANAPAPSPYDAYIAVDDYSNIAKLEIMLSEDGVEYNQTEKLDYPQETRRNNERVFDFYNKDGQFESFKLQVTFTNGEVQVSNGVDFADWSDYIYNAENNTLAQGEITSWKITSFGIILVPTLLILPLIVTLIVEWGVSFAFHLEPGKYVVIINLITNLFMNILILVIFNRFMLNYYVILIILELCMAALEFLFYTFKYKQYSKKRLLLFTVVANLASWGVYYLIGNWIIYSL